MTREAERKRLIELFKEMYPKTRYFPMEECQAMMADFLLDNGIGIKPPKELCEKKGDYIFVIDEGDIFKGFLALVGYDYKGEEEVIVYYEDEPHFYKFTDYGKTVFLTREEAEKALEGNGE